MPAWPPRWPPRWPRACSRRAARGGRARGHHRRGRDPGQLSGTGPITFATGKLDTGYLPGLVAAVERGAPAAAGHRHLPARRLRRAARPAGREPPGPQRCLRRDEPGRGLDRRVRRRTAGSARSARSLAAARPTSCARRWTRPPMTASCGRSRSPATPACCTTARTWSRRPAGDLGAAGPRRARRSRRGITWRGYAGQFAAYEGLTVNFAEAVQSAGGSHPVPGRRRGPR